jgi:hypothetical protein
MLNLKQYNIMKFIEQQQKQMNYIENKNVLKILYD